jgi:hypothetical protein
VPVSWTTVITAAAATASTQIAPSHARRERRRRGQLRTAHSLTVVARTGPQDGTPGRACGTPGRICGAADRTVSVACCSREPVNGI